ncbi:hypothetical protein BC941DRAFT_509782 [Chlamydoabsidia padenii]|nr:hypothetical protein BC941DRAFT_509782 [Chlamydoabsidia padenii]
MNKTLVILATHSLPSQLEIDIENKEGPEFLCWKGVPKALLPISSRPALSRTMNQCQHLFLQTYVVTNAHNYRYFERWATGVGLPKSNVINCGVSAGPVEDIALVGRVKDLKGEAVVISCDLYYTVGIMVDRVWPAVAASEEENPSSIIPFGIVPISWHSVIALAEEKGPDDSHYTAEGSISKLSDSIPLNCQLEYSKSEPGSTLGHDYLQHKVTLDQYQQHWVKMTGNDDKIPPTDLPPQQINVKAYARVGLMGNPSDGFNGKTMSLLISNFWAQVTLASNYTPDQDSSSWPNGGTGGNAHIKIIHKPTTEPTRFANLNALALDCEQDGYDNADRLLLACCRVFYNYCQRMHIPLNTEVGFQILFDTNIPRQVGLAGSSAIITACWRALMAFYRIPKIQPEVLAGLILSVEVNELGIAAGLQDRVIQTYGGLVYMDFNKTLMDQAKHGNYIPLDPNLLPPLYLAYVADPEDSGKVHSTVKQRFLNGDTEIIQAMQQFGNLTDQARTALENGDHHAFAQLMTENFELRRKTYGDDVVGAKNLQMVNIVRRHGGHAKFSGSGGAIVIFMPDTSRDAIKPLQQDLQKSGFVFVKLEPMESQI